MKNVLCLFFLLITFLSFAQTKVLSWNLQNLGKSKSESTLDYIAKKASAYDIIAIQEVVAGAGGAQTVAKIAQILNEKGFKWEYKISEPTTSSSYKTERYAFLWKTSKAKLKNQPWLEGKYNLEIDREPYFATFEINKKSITLVNFHAITKKKQPETEIKYFKFLPSTYSDLNLVFLGDFNCPETHSVFNPLKKMGYEAVLKNQKTTLKQKCKNNICLASEFDNIFYKTSSLKVLNYGVIKFYEDFESLEEARKISDHIPIWFEFTLN